MWLTPKLFSSSATLIRSPGLISPASRARRSRSVTLSTMLTRWMVSSRTASIVMRLQRPRMHLVIKYSVASRTAPSPHVSRLTTQGGRSACTSGVASKSPCARPEHAGLCPRRAGELQPDRDPERVEAGAHRTRRQADEILRRRVAHDEIAERELDALVHDRLLPDRQRRSRR